MASFKTSVTVAAFDDVESKNNDENTLANYPNPIKIVEVQKTKFNSDLKDFLGIKKVKLAERQEQVARQSKVSCKRRSMYINFEEIGWKEWKIAPLGFDAYYCGGQCGYDEAQVIFRKFANHAFVKNSWNF